MSDLTTELAIYSGEVQGVGFRYTVRSIARHHPVTGYVRNLPDGTVEIVAQGGRGAIDAFLSEVAGRFRQNIRHCEQRPLAGSEAFEHFEIRP
jgi:acylphosphatase